MADTVTRDTTGDVYRIRATHEWATIVVFGWQATGNDGTPRECGEVLVNSSFGQWAYSWGHMGVSVKRFLIGAERGYMAGKFMAADAYKLDGPLSVRELRARIIAWRKCDDFTKIEARTAWDYLEEREVELEANTHDFVGAMQQAETELVMSRGLRRFFQEPWEHLQTSLDIQFQGFWREIWPVFVAALRRELEASPA